MTSPSLPFRAFAQIAFDLRITYWREAFRAAPVSSALRALVFVAVVAQALLAAFGVAVTPLPQSVVAELRGALDDVRAFLLVILPVAYLLQQIFSPSFFLRQSSSIFFCPYPIRRLHLALLRWVEGGLTMTQIAGASALFMVVVLTTPRFPSALWQCFVLWCVLRSFVMLCHELYCLIADRPALVYALYLGATSYAAWSFIRFAESRGASSVGSSPARSLEASPDGGGAAFSLSSLIFWFDAEFVQRISATTVVANGAIICGLFAAAAWLYGYRMKNIAKYP